MVRWWMAGLVVGALAEGATAFQLFSLPLLSTRSSSHAVQSSRLGGASIHKAPRGGNSGLKMMLDPGMGLDVAQLGLAVEAAGISETISQQISKITVDDVAGGLFAFSLFPYLGFLYHLGKPESKTPELGLFGFKFLLAFVGVSIPAAIAAKVLYGAQLADVDLLHGSAESFLTLTNLFIVLGFRRALTGPVDGLEAQARPETDLQVNPAVTAGALGLSALALGSGIHPEPSNALSFPTWMVHTSSLIEWLTAMGLIWRYAEVTGNPRWKGLTWGMLPFHASGLCACTYHFFYNAPPVGLCVALQSALTVVGDFTCWWAAYRIYQYAKDQVSTPEGVTVELPDSELGYFSKLFALVVVTSAAVKWGELYLDLPFEPSMTAACALIFGPTALNVLAWLQRAQSNSNQFNEFY